MRRLKAWWVLLALFVVANVWLLWPKGAPGTDIPYSVFVAQVRAGNVDAVRISGEHISGTLVHAATVADLLGQQAGSSGGSRSGVTARFHTVYPAVVGDVDLMALLDRHDVRVEVSAPSSPWLGLLLINAIPMALLAYSLLRARGGGVGVKGQDKILNFGRSTARRQAGTHGKVTFDDVAGADEAKRDLQEVADFLRFPRRYYDMGARIPRGVLLVGPPGTGKTLLARAVSGEAGVPFFHINATEFVEIFVGVGASRVRDLFDQAKHAAPSIVFIDELDAVGRRREGGLGNVSHEREQTLNQLLVEMDGFEDRHEVIVMAATNRPDVLDPALLRPGRFDRQVAVGLPDRAGREAILRVHTQRLPLSPDVGLDMLARSTTGFSGADLANLANEAALTAVRNAHSMVMPEDFGAAIDKIVLGGERPLILNDEDRRIVAYHEAGHALVAWLMPSADPVQKVTIIPRGRSLGATQQLPGEDKYNYTRTYLLARLSVMLGGRAAEEIALGEVTTGAEQDLMQASRLLRRMITQWGMGDLGLAAFEAGEDDPYLGADLSMGRSLSEATSARVEQNVEKVLGERYDSVCELLTTEKARLETLADALLREETIEHHHLVEILGPPAHEHQPPEGTAPERAMARNS
ncbi:MAG: ATP-dependent zinc metalloprotease FtsH [Chloroflexi bacterium]|nr:ATP-dependent zinc metalloprotease FtsH [Chloroflexota bacterium]